MLYGFTMAFLDLFGRAVLRLVFQLFRFLASLVLLAHVPSPFLRIKNPVPGTAPRPFFTWPGFAVQPIVDKIVRISASTMPAPRTAGVGNRSGSKAQMVPWLSGDSGRMGKALLRDDLPILLKGVVIKRI